MGNFALLYALCQVAETHRKNDFRDYSDVIAFWTEESFGEGKRFTFLISVGEKLTYFENESTGGENFRTMLVGDKKNPYLRINDHGTGLKGLVSVHMSAIEENGQVRISIDVYPLTIQDTPLTGIIWFDDLFTLGNSPSRGGVHVWSADHIVIPSPNPSEAIFNHMIQGFCFGMVMADPKVENIQIINRFDQIGIMSPVGFSANPFKEDFFIADAKKLHKPDEMTEIRFRILELLFEESIAILSQEAIAARLIKKFTAKEVAKLIFILSRMAKDGWFSQVAVREKIYLVPTPKLLVSI